MGDIDERIERRHQRVAVLDELMAEGYRHCGQPVEAGAGGVICTVPLEPGEQPHPYAAHIRCQDAVLEQLAEASHEAGTRWRLTPEGARVVAAERTQAYLADATVEAAVRMEDASSLVERLAQRDEWGG